MHESQTKTSQNRMGSAHTRTSDKCGRCGGDRHPRTKCPANDAQCHNCKMKGYYSTVCHNKSVSTIEEDPTNSAFLDTLGDKNERVWTSVLTILGKQVTFKVDTGAEVTAISKAAWEVLDKPTLQLPNKRLYGPSQQPLKSPGSFLCSLNHKGKLSQQQVFVVDDLEHNLLGLPAITALHLVARADTV